MIETQKKKGMKEKSAWLLAKESIKIMLPLLIYIVLIVISIRLLPVKNLVVYILVVLIWTWALKIYNGWQSNDLNPSFKEYVWSSAKTSLILCVFYLVFGWLGGFGWLGLFIIIVGYVGYRLIRGRREYVRAMETVETMAFGEPLIKKENEKR